VAAFVKMPAAKFRGCFTYYTFLVELFKAVEQLLPMMMAESGLWSFH